MEKEIQDELYGIKENVLSNKGKVFRVEVILGLIAAIASFLGFNGYMINDELEEINRNIFEVNRFLNDSDKYIDSLKKDLSDHTDSLKRAQNINFSFTKQENGNIRELGKHLKVTIPVKEGDKVHAYFTGSAKNTKMHYTLVGSGEGIETLFSALQPFDGNIENWRSISTQAVFQATIKGVLTVEIEFRSRDAINSAIMLDQGIITLRKIRSY